MARSLVWNDLSMKEIYEFNALHTADEGIKFIQRCCNIPDEQGTNGILLDLYFHALNFAKDQRFSPEQASTLFSILKQTHADVTSSPFSRLEKDFAGFRDLVLRHSVHRPPFSVGVFGFRELKAVTEYVASTYFRHYLMYKYAFTKKVRLSFRIENADGTPRGSIVDADGGELLTASAIEGGFEGGSGGGVEDIINAASAAPLATEDIQTAAVLPGGGDFQDSEEKVPTIAALVAAAVTGDEIVMDEKDPLASQQQQPQQPARLTPQEIAAAELRNLVLTTLQPKLDEMKAALMSRLSSHEESIKERIKRLEMEEEALVAGATTGANPIATKKKEETKAKGKK